MKVRSFFTSAIAAFVLCALLPHPVQAMTPQECSRNFRARIAELDREMTDLINYLRRKGDKNAVADAEAKFKPQFEGNTKEYMKCLSKAHLNPL